MGVLFPKWVPPPSCCVFRYQWPPVDDILMGPCEMILVNWSNFFGRKMGIAEYPQDFHGLSGFILTLGARPSIFWLTRRSSRCHRDTFARQRFQGAFWGLGCHGLSHVEPQIHQNQSGYTWELMVTFGDGLFWCLFYWCFMGTCCFSGRIDENVGEAPSYLQSLPISRCRLSPMELAPQNDCVTFETSVGWHLGISSDCFFLGYSFKGGSKFGGSYGYSMDL